MLASATELTIDNELQLTLNRYSSFDPHRKLQTKIIVRENESDHWSLKKENDDACYYTGYLKWYFGRHGLFKTLYGFFSKRFIFSFFYNVFNGFGLAIGAFLFKRTAIPYLGLSAYI